MNITDVSTVDKKNKKNKRKLFLRILNILETPTCLLMMILGYNSLGI